MRRLLFVLSLLVASISQASPVVPPSVYFVENQGQWQGDFRFRTALGHGAAFVTESGLVLDLRAKDEGGRMKDEFGRRDEGGGMRDEGRTPMGGSVLGHVLRLTFLDANQCPDMLGLDKLASYSNYFLGRDSSRWKSRVGHYQRVLAQQVWPGINVEYVLKPGGVELVYHLQAGVDPAQIQIQIEGLSAPLTLDGAGNLVLSTSLGPLVEQAPTAFQAGRAIPCRYRLISDSTYSFTLDGYDPQQELVIDPLLYSTFLGPTWDGINKFQIDPRDQSLVVAGRTFYETFPTTPGAYQDSLRGGDDIFIARFADDGRSLLFSTYLGGSNTESPRGLTLTPNGAIYVGGYTLSVDWPLTNDATDTTFVGQIAEGYFSRLAPDGTTLEFSSYWGGNGGDYVIDLQCDDAGSLYLYGFTGSLDFPTTSGALFPLFQGDAPAYISVFDPTTAQILYSTFFPGAEDVYARQIVVLEPMHVWITGYTDEAGGIVITPDALQPDMQFHRPSFLAKLNLAAGVVEYSSYFGGNDYTDINAILPQPDNRLFLAGTTLSTNFPVTAGTFDTTHTGNYIYKAFATYFDPPTTVVRSTLFGMRQSGGTVFDLGADIVTADSSVILCGYAQGSGFPTTPGALDSVTGPEWPDAWFAVLSADLSTLRYSTLMGGYDKDYFSRVQVSPDNTVWLAGLSECYDFPVTPDAFQNQQLGWGDGVLCQFSLPWIDAAADPLILHPSTFILSAYPNPFNSTTTLRFTLPAPCEVTLILYDLMGRKLLHEEFGRLTAGEHCEPLRVEELASGFYFVRLDAGIRSATQRILLLR